MSIDFFGQSLSGVPGDVSHPVSETLLPGESEPVTVTFAPTSEQYDDCVLRLEGDFEPL